MHHGEAGRLRGEVGESRQQAIVVLDRHDRCPNTEQRVGERPDAGTDLEDRLAGLDSGEFEDPADDVVVDEEVLAERLARAQPVAIEGGDRGRGAGQP